MIGLCNLSALTTLELDSLYATADEAWPISLREVSVHGTLGFSIEIADRIAALPELTSLSTDWMFAFDEVLDSYPPQLFHKLSGVSSLQRLSVIEQDLYFDEHMLASLFNWAGAMISLHELKLCDIGSFGVADDVDMQWLASLTNLQHATFIRCGAFTDQVLALPNLHTLTIDHCRCEAISNVRGCSQLRELTHLHNGFLSNADVQAITNLHQLERLRLECKLTDPTLLSGFCGMHTLRQLRVPLSTGRIISATSLASLPDMRLLEDVALPPVDNTKELWDLFVRMPQLRRITVRLGCKLRGEEKRILRDALPRLESLKVVLTRILGD